MSMVMVLLLMLFGLIAPAAAQGNPLVNCSGLSEADCALLQDAAAASSSLRSFSMPAWAIRLELNAGAESVRFASEGSGRIILPPALLALVSEIPSDPTDTAALLAFYRSLNAAQIADILQNSGLQMVFDRAEIVAPGTMLLGAGEVDLRDAGLYLHLFSPTGADAWFGDQLQLAEDALDELITGLQALQEQLDSPEAQQALEQADALNLLLSPISDILNAHVSTTRGPDVVLHGQPAAAFTTTVDLKGFLADPALASVLLQVLKDPQIGTLLGTEMGDLGQINQQQIQLVLLLASTLLGKTSVTSSLWVGLEDGYFHKLAFDVVLDVNLSLLGDETLQQITGGLSFFSEIDEINTATLEGLALPDTVLPLESTSEFLAGTPALIEGALALGGSYAGSFDYGANQQDVLSLPLTVGEAINLVLDADDYAYVDLYGPDGFLVQTFDSYYDEIMPITAEQTGTYIVVVRSYWDMIYSLVVEARTSSASTALSCADFPQFCVPLIGGAGEADFAAFEAPTARTLDQAPSAAEMVVRGMTSDNMPTLGNPAAPIHFRVVTNFGCPHCNRYATGDLARFIEDYVLTGQATLDLVLVANTSPRAPAEAAAFVALCAGEQGAFWEMSTTLDDIAASSGGGFTLEALAPVAQAMGLDSTALVQCATSGRYAGLIATNEVFMRNNAVLGTPTLMVRSRDAEGWTRIEHSERGYDSMATMTQQAAAQ